MIIVMARRLDTLCLGPLYRWDVSADALTPLEHDRTCSRGSFSSVTRRSLACIVMISQCSSRFGSKGSSLVSFFASVKSIGFAQLICTISRTISVVNHQHLARTIVMAASAPHRLPHRYRQYRVCTLTFAMNLYAGTTGRHCLCLAPGATP